MDIAVRSGPVLPTSPPTTARRSGSLNQGQEGLSALYRRAARRNLVDDTDAIVRVDAVAIW